MSVTPVRIFTLVGAQISNNVVSGMSDQLELF
jgi:hypothetical protein